MYSHFFKMWRKTSTSYIIKKEEKKGMLRENSGDIIIERTAISLVEYPSIFRQLIINPTYTQQINALFVQRGGESKH